MFNPSKRLTAAQALQHPYVAQFHNADLAEPALGRPIVLPISDNTKYSVTEYRWDLGATWEGAAWELGGRASWVVGSLEGAMDATRGTRGVAMGG